jgi:RNA polymerase sigma-70 factor (sigma-E family)
VAAEEPGFQEFYAAQYGRLHRLGYWLTGDWGQAEELAQEALVGTWWRWPLVRRLDRPGDYARKVLVNRHRSLRRRALVEARYAARVRTEAVVPFDGHEDAAVLVAALRRLTPRQRAVVVLRFGEDLPVTEVARLLGTSVSAVKSTSNRALARLRSQLGPSAEVLTRSAKRRRGEGDR